MTLSPAQNNLAPACALEGKKEKGEEKTLAQKHLQNSGMFWTDTISFFFATLKKVLYMHLFWKGLYTDFV